MKINLNALATALREKFGYDLSATDLQQGFERKTLLITETPAQGSEGETGFMVEGVGYFTLTREFYWKYSAYLTERNQIEALTGPDRTLAKVLEILDATVAANKKVTRHCKPLSVMYGREIVTIP